MFPTELIRPPRADGPAEPSGDSRRDARSAPPTGPTLVEALDETFPLVDYVPVAGPPALFLAGPWLLLALALMGPFALLLTFALAVVVVVAALALAGATLAAPFLVVRHLRRRPRRGRPVASATPAVASGAARLQPVRA